MELVYNCEISYIDYVPKGKFDIEFGVDGVDVFF